MTDDFLKGYSPDKYTRDLLVAIADGPYHDSNLRSLLETWQLQARIAIRLTDEEMEKHLKGLTSEELAKIDPEPPEFFNAVDKAMDSSEDFPLTMSPEMVRVGWQDLAERYEKLWQEAEARLVEWNLLVAKSDEIGRLKEQCKRLADVAMENGTQLHRFEVALEEIATTDFTTSSPLITIARRALDMPEVP